MDPDTYAAIDRSVRKAVDKINGDIRPYLKYMIREVPADIATLTEDDFYLGRFRYIYPRPYTQEEFTHIHDWMVDWGLLEADSGYTKIIDEKMRTGIDA